MHFCNDYKTCFNKKQKKKSKLVQILWQSDSDGQFQTHKKKIWIGLIRLKQIQQVAYKTSIHFELLSLMGIKLEPKGN